MKTQRQEKKVSVVDEYVQQAAENHALKVDTNFWMVVKQKPKWMPLFLYKLVIKNLVEFQEHHYLQEANKD
jgi:hypothetical protein